MVHFFLQSLVLLGALVVFQRPPDLEYFPVLLLAIVVLLLLATALAIALSAVNVYLRDTEHLLELVLLAWFWMSAIAYPLPPGRRASSRHSSATQGEWIARRSTR